MTAAAGLLFAAVAGAGLAQITGGTAQDSTETTLSTTVESVPSSSTTGAMRGETEPAESETEATETEGAETESAETRTTSTIAAQTTAGAPATTTHGQQKVAVCHHTGSGGEHTIVIAEPAVAAHLAHGDSRGACTAHAAPAPAPAPPRAAQHPHHRSKPAHAERKLHTSHGHGHAGSKGNSGHHGKGK
jgi:hypothetical protein